jgi:hypothetical protein
MKFIGNRLYFDNEDIAPKGNINFTLKALKKNVPQMLCQIPQPEYGM